MSSKLSDEEMEFVRVRLLDKESYSSIAKALGKSPGTIRGAINEMASRMATGLKDYDLPARQVLLNKAFEKCEWLVNSCTDEIRFEKLVNSMRTLMEIRQNFDAGSDLPDARNLSLNIVLNGNNTIDEEEDLPELHRTNVDDEDAEILESPVEDGFKKPQYHPENPFFTDDP